MKGQVKVRSIRGVHTDLANAARKRDGIACDLRANVRDEHSLGSACVETLDRVGVVNLPGLQLGKLNSLPPIQPHLKAVCFRHSDHGSKVAVADALLRIGSMDLDAIARSDRPLFL